MPVVQRYQQGNVDPSNIPNVRISDSNVNADTFGGGIAESLSGFARIANDFAVKEQKKADDSAMMTAETEMADLENEMFYSETGALNTRGKDAIGVGATVMPEYERRTAEIIARTPKRVQTQIQALAHGRKLDSQRSLMRHVSNESDKYYGAQAKGMIDLSVNSAGVNYNDAKRVETEAAKAALAADKLSELGGFALDDDVAVNARLEASSAVFGSVISRKIQDDPFEAETYFLSVQDRLSADSQLRIKSMLDPYIKSAEYDEMAQNIGTGKAPKISASDSESLIASVLQTEGGYNASDGNSGKPVIYGLNAKYNPKEFAEAKRITDEQGAEAGKAYASDVYKEKYWDAAGLDKVPTAVRGQMFDAAVNMGVDTAKNLYKQSGGNPEKFAELRRAKYRAIVAKTPSQAEYLESWLARVDKYAGGGEVEAPKTISEARALVRSTIQNPRDRREVESRLALNFQIKADDERQKQELFSLDIYDRIQKAGGKTPIEKLFSPTEMAQAYKYGYGDNIESLYKASVLNTYPKTDFALHEQLRKQSLDDPDAFVKNDFLKLADKLSLDDRADFIKLKSDMLNPEKRKDAQTKLGSESELFGFAYNDLGIADNPAKSKEENKAFLVKRSQFESVVMDAKRKFINRFKREPDSEEFQQMINSLKLPMARKNSDETKRSYELTTKDEAVYTEVPTAQRKQIVDYLEKSGAIATEARIRAMYNNSKGSDL